MTVTTIEAALTHGEELELHLNLANAGAIAGIDPDDNVELPVTLRGGEIQRRPVRFPAAITAEMARVGREQALIAQARRTYDEETLIEALCRTGGWRRG